MERRIMKLEVRYQLKTGTEGKESKPRFYEEHLLLDREANTITYTQVTSPRYHITKTCYVEEGVALLLDKYVPECFMEANDTEALTSSAYSIPRYEIMISLEDGSAQKSEGVFDDLGLPRVWRDFVDAVKRFTQPIYHDEMLDPYAYDRHYRREGDLIVCQVRFGLSMQTYTYLAHEDIYEEDDAVLVPVGSENQEKRAYIDSVRYCKKENIDFPFEKLKYIIGKSVDEDDDDDPDHDADDHVNDPAGDDTDKGSDKSKVLATGRFAGEYHRFEATLVNGVLQVECKTRELNDDEQKYLMKAMIICIKTAPPIAETYYPPVNSLNAAYSGFHNRFFDNDDFQVEVEGELEQIPNVEEGEEVFY